MKEKTPKERIIALRKSNPCVTMTAIAKQVGVTYQYVQQTLLAEGLPTKHFVRGWTCQKCGVTFFKVHYTSRKYRNVYCDACWQEVSKVGVKVPISCTQCGKITYRRQSEVWQRQKSNGKLREQFFCSRQCFGAWMKENTILKGNKVNHATNINKRKHDYELIWAKHIETGYGQDKLSKLLNIHPSTVSYILAYKKRELLAKR